MMSDTSLSQAFQEVMEKKYATLCHETKVFLKYCPNEWWEIWSNIYFDTPSEALPTTPMDYNFTQIAGKMEKGMIEWVQSTLNDYALNSFTLELLGDWKIRYDRLAYTLVEDCMRNDPEHFTVNGDMIYRHKGLLEEGEE